MNLYACGCGALGSRIVLDVARYFEQIVLIDDDIIEVTNIGTSSFWQEDVDMFKAQALAEKLWRKDRIAAEPHTRTLDRPIEQKFSLTRYDVVLDTFDNPRARNLTVWGGKIWGGWTLHVGVGEVGNGSIMWAGPEWSLPVDFERGDNPVCTNELGHQLLQFTASVAVGSIIAFVREGVRNSYVVRDDMSVVVV